MEGVGLLKEVETLDSNYLEAQHHLMLLDLQSGQLEKAKKRIKKLLFLQPGNQQYADILLKLETNTLK
jgi:predicted Zn-dependent protease